MGSRGASEQIIAHNAMDIELKLKGALSQSFLLLHSGGLCRHLVGSNSLVIDDSLAGARPLGSLFNLLVAVKLL